MILTTHDVLDIQRQLGVLEGVICAIDDSSVSDTIFSAVSIIDDILFPKIPFSDGTEGQK